MTDEHEERRRRRRRMQEMQYGPDEHGHTDQEWPEGWSHDNDHELDRRRDDVL